MKNATEEELLAAVEAERPELLAHVCARKIRGQDKEPDCWEQVGTKTLAGTRAEHDADLVSVVHLRTTAGWALVALPNASPRKGGRPNRERFSSTTYVPTSRPRRDE